MEVYLGLRNKRKKEIISECFKQQKPNVEQEKQDDPARHVQGR